MHENTAFFTYAYGDLDKDPLDQSVDMHRSRQDAENFAKRWRSANMTVHIYKGEKQNDG